MEQIQLYNWLARAYTGAPAPEPLNEGDVVDDYHPPLWFSRSIVMERMKWTVWEYWSTPAYIIRDLIRTWNVQSQVERDHQDRPNK